MPSGGGVRYNVHGCVARFSTGIAGAIPAIVELLKDSDSDVRSSAVSVLGKVSEQAEFRAAIVLVIPAIVELLSNWSWDVQLNAVLVLGKVSEQAEFRVAIVPVIPTGCCHEH
ncbi:hypothetical protein BU17DRAFT_87839 [Hysterangium stoloniferum]|nr:hypothetical protein BU17DRAFT_87839 [Hysterangium stoloniferum]